MTHSLIDTLSSRLGAAHVLTAATDIAPHLAETRGLYRGEALAVVRPRNTEEVAFAVGTCAAARVPVVAHGGNTGLVGGGVPYGGVVISLSRLDRVRAVDPLDATITVEAGCVLANVQQRPMRRHAVSAVARLRGLVPDRRQPRHQCRRHGGARLRQCPRADAGLEVVLADGQVWNGLRALRKDNSGYDLKNLFVGSEGTLGIITAAVLRLHPRPVSKATAFLGLASARPRSMPSGPCATGSGPGSPPSNTCRAFPLEVVLRHLPGAVRPLAGDHHSYALVELVPRRAPTPTRNWKRV